MARAARSIFVLVLVVGLLTAGAAVLIRAQTRSWFESDVNLRARLAVNGARAELLDSWRTDPTQLAMVLGELARDEEILGACACTGSGESLARTGEYPPEMPCSEVLAYIQADGPDDRFGHWSRVQPLPGGEVHFAALPLGAGSGEGLTEGFVVLAHDYSFVAIRETRALFFLLAVFVLLSLGGGYLTIRASRRSWRTWSEELRGFLQGDGPPKAFKPILSDVRELVDRLMDQEGRAWTPKRLKETLRHQLEGETVVVLANREPYVHQRKPNGEIETMHPASGLVTALEPIMRACSGTWIAHGAGSADRDTSDRNGRLRVPPGEGSYTLRRIWLTTEEERGYYYGFANEGLWPLCHIAHTRPLFRSEDWEYYRSVNKKFALTVREEVDSDDPIVLVQDYHFAVAPAFIRQKLPKATIISFWHIPWPNAELFGICPFRDELLEGMLGASILGFHTQFHCNNFLDAVDRFLEARIDRERNAVVYRGRETLVRPYPISIEWPMRQLDTVPAPEEARRLVAEELGLGPDVKIGVGVDRLDYTKGIEERLLAVERLFERRPDFIGHFTFVQLAAPSRTSIERYQLLNEQVDAIARRIDERFRTDDWHPIILRREHHEPPTVFRFLRAGDLCYVSSLHDGMNLVAKEYVASREDERGVLVLSQFTGAARELTEALIVNPYNLDEAADAMAAALDMAPEEQAARMRAMRSLLAEYNVYRWAGRMLLDAARLRRSERLAERLADSGTRSEFVLR